MDHETQNVNTAEEGEKSFKLPKLSKPQLILISLGIAVVAILLTLQFTKGVFVAATVNGSPISRLAVISELEGQSGKQALDSLITKKLIENETKSISISEQDIDSEIEKIKQQVASQGGTLDDALEQQGMTMEQLREQITVQKKLEKLLADKILISDEDVNAYIKDNKITPSNGQNPENVRTQVKEQLQQQKFGQVAQEWLSELKAEAKIKYYVEY